MPYWFLNKQTKKTGMYGSLPVLCRENDLEYKQLQNHFRRNTTLENKSLWIERQEILKSKWQASNKLS